MNRFVPQIKLFPAVVAVGGSSLEAPLDLQNRIHTAGPLKVPLVKRYPHQGREAWRYEENLVSQSKEGSKK